MKKKKTLGLTDFVLAGVDLILDVNWGDEVATLHGDEEHWMLNVGKWVKRMPKIDSRTGKVCQADG